MQSVDETTATQLRPFWQAVFADGSVTLPEGEVRPAHWRDEKLDWRDFEKAWRAWQAEIGFDPDDPATWDAAGAPG
ncbi:hypothetical protein [Tropicibacter oceani]|uniref:Uncharacterized protein n=1 Tax=Tropicibacter oceani TaxID=3058420 RepID=A0ABY8QFG2_9RHOB|nr:hypothetical protein [Tropicibacter oceani]WGW03264.1 hypothetical protein QF118_15225 [Tropicibacter oceani]